MPASVELVVVDESRKCPLRPASGRWIQVVREDADGRRDGDALDTEKGELLLPVDTLPVETRRGNRRVREPGERDVVEDIVSCEAAGLSGKSASDQLVAARVVIEEIRGQADGGIRDPVERLRAQPHLVGVADALRIDEGQALVRESLVGGEAGWRRSAGLESLVNVGWNHARHVGVNTEQLWGRLGPHHLRDDRAPIAALRREWRVAQALHQYDPS